MLPEKCCLTTKQLPATLEMTCYRAKSKAEGESSESNGTAEVQIQPDLSKRAFVRVGKYNKNRRKVIIIFFFLNVKFSLETQIQK